MSKKKLPENVLGYECRHVVFCEPQNPRDDDFHLVKEIVHYTDGTTRPNLRLWKNYQRPFYVTKQAKRNHEDKKEWEKVEHLNVFQCRQTDLIRKAAAAIGEPWFKGNLRKLARSPYLYGADILSTATLKADYQNKFPNLITPYQAAAFDIETDVLHGTNGPILSTIAYQDKVYTVIKKSFVEGYSNVIPRLHELMEKYIGDYMRKRKMSWEPVLVDDTLEVATGCIYKAHEWKPDFLAIWNMDFDIPRIVEVMEKCGVNPADVFSDPCVPPQYRHYEYKRGPSQKVTASGKMMPIKPAGRWHTVFTPASFYVIDAMCAYRHIRNQMAEEQSYSLDAILNKHLKVGKLKFTEASHLPEGTLPWHIFMQEHYPLEYTIYNVFDTVSMLELDDEIKDLQFTLPMFSGYSDFQNFKSQPRRIVDKLHYFCQENDLVIATTSDEMATEEDELTIGLDDWIITLPAHLVEDNGLRVIKDMPELATNIRAHVGDLDVSASYPNGEDAMNISKETTHREVVDIEGVSEYTRRMQGLNLSAGHVNAVEFCTDLFGMPQLTELLSAFEEDHVNMAQTEHHQTA
jgi:hypothetical protein